MESGVVYELLPANSFTQLIKTQRASFVADKNNVLKKALTQL
ncbi:MAG: hypothetical protein P8H51_01480 [Flavobacteriaceae bacterium]|nr:hypothetical protein [Flavobacteriaceae bacterium]MDG2503515.1 hypothetical protein [Flavobacteriaceae bacterium]